MVRIFKSNENDLAKYLTTNALSYDKYIFMTRNKKTRENKIPCQEIYDKLEISDVPQTVFKQIKDCFDISVVTIQMMENHGENSNASN